MAVVPPSLLWREQINNIPMMPKGAVVGCQFDGAAKGGKISGKRLQFFGISRAKEDLQLALPLIIEALFRREIEGRDAHAAANQENVAVVRQGESLPQRTKNFKALSLLLACQHRRAFADNLEEQLEMTVLVGQVHREGSSQQRIIAFPGPDHDELSGPCCGRNLWRLNGQTVDIGGETLDFLYNCGFLSRAHIFN